MKKTILLLTCLLSSIFVLTAQRDARLARQLQSLEKVAQLRMPQQNNTALRAKELSARRPGRANHFAIPMQVQQTPKMHGTWERSPDGTDVWRLRVYSEGAKSLNLGFTKYVMPEGGKLFLYTSDYNDVKGPFTPHDNEAHEQLWTPILLGDEIVIEVQLPLNNKEDLQLELSAVNHDFMGIVAEMSGACNLDVLCGAADGFPDVDNYRDIIQSVAFTHLNGFANCTGFLVNNTAQDGRPYFMTAHHCGVGVAEAPSLVTYWNFQNSYCRQPNSPESGLDGDGVLNTFNTGSVLRSSWATSDFVLVELDDPVIDEANAYFAGWTAEETLPTKGIAIHHPSNDEKRISFENDNAFYLSTWNASPSAVENGDHIIVEDWDVGTTEGGSSGSPLFDQNKRVVGQLHGGAAGCGNDEYDVYGWFATSWEGGGTPETRLRDWLDPINSGILTLDGNNGALSLADTYQAVCNDAAAIATTVSVGQLFTDMVTLTLSEVPSGVNASLSQTQINPNESATLTISDFDNLAVGVYTILVNATDGENTGTANFTLQIYEPFTNTPVLAQPANNALDVATFTEFVWQTNPNVQGNELQIATDAAFSNIIETITNISTNTYNGTVLEPLTQYFWRVQYTNLCETSDWSNVYSFTTANTACSVTMDSDTPVTIGTGGPAVYSSTITVTEKGKIEDINVLNIQGTHTWISDLEVTLISPTGTEVLLWSEQCGSEDNFDINFDDAATETAIVCPMTNGQMVQPQGTLADFNGEEALGDWTLQVEDLASQDGGALDHWELQLCITPDNALSLVSSIASVAICQDQSLVFDLEVGSGFENNISLDYIVEPSVPFKITYNTDPTNVAPGSTVEVTIASFMGIGVGAYDITFTAADGENTATSVVQVNVIEMLSAANLLLPLDAAVDVPLNPLFEWAPLTGSGYMIEIATDIDFDNIIHTNAISGSNYQLNPILEAFTQYFWRITTINECGEVVSEIFSFSTDDAVGIEEQMSESVEVFPNPTSDELHIRFGQTTAVPLDISLFDYHGRQVLREQYAALQTASFSLGTFPKGVYVLKIQSPTGQLYKRIVLQ